MSERDTSFGSSDRRFSQFVPIERRKFIPGCIIIAVDQRPVTDEKGRVDKKKLGEYPSFPSVLLADPQFIRIRRLRYQGQFAKQQIKDGRTVLDFRPSSDFEDFLERQIMVARRVIKQPAKIPLAYYTSILADYRRDPEALIHSLN